MDTLRRLFLYTWRYRKLAFLAYGALLSTTLLSLVIPRLIGGVVDEALGGEQGQAAEGGAAASVETLLSLDPVEILFLFAGFILAATLVKGIFTFSQVFVGEYLSQRVCFDLRNRIFNQYQRLSFAYHDRSQTGQLMSRATSDVEQIRFFVSQGLINGASMLLTFVAILAVLLLMNWQLALLSLATMPVLFVIALLFARQLRPMFSLVQQETAELSTVLQEDLSGMRVVRAFAQEDRETDKFLFRSDKLAVATSRTMELFAMRNPLLQFIAGIGTTAVVWYGGLQVIAGGMSIGMLVTFTRLPHVVATSDPYVGHDDQYVRPGGRGGRAHLRNPGHAIGN